MKLRYLIAILTVVTLAAVRTAAAPETWTGKIADSMCKADHAKNGGTTEKDHKCTLDCVKGMGGEYVLVVEKDKKFTTFKIANQKFADLEVHAGHLIEMTGELKGDTITVSKIVMPKVK